MIKNKIKKALIPVAGLGTRMLPATKAIPKELLPIYDKPIIQYVVEEALEAGIDEIIFITRSGKESIENHFDVNYELEKTLKKNNDSENLNKINITSNKKLKISSVRQEAPNGLGDAILCAKNFVRNDEPFAVLLPDEFLLSSIPGFDLKKLVSSFNKTGFTQLLIEKIPKKLVSFYGMVQYQKSSKTNILKIIEKPKPEICPSRDRVIGRYLFPYEIFNYLSKIKPGKNHEIQLTDAINLLLEEKQNHVNTIISESRVYDCGSKKGFIGANLEMSLLDKGMKKYLKQIIMN